MIEQVFRTDLCTYDIEKETNICRFFCNKGFLIKSKKNLSFIFKHIKLFLYTQNNYILNTYPQISDLFNYALDKRFNTVFVLEHAIGIIKPPFTAKSFILPKALRKKDKKKYKVKIVYLKKEIRNDFAIRQLYRHTGDFLDSKFPIRLYKSILTTFLGSKKSYLYTLKQGIFKKFLKSS